MNKCPFTNDKMVLDLSRSRSQVDFSSCLGCFDVEVVFLTRNHITQPRFPEISQLLAIMGNSCLLCY